jgi:hypothetical protein
VEELMAIMAFNYYIHLFHVHGKAREYKRVGGAGIMNLIKELKLQTQRTYFCRDCLPVLFSAFCLLLTK